MLQNFIKIALRNLRKRKLYSFINIIGLAAGLASFLLIALFITHELSYERWNPNADRILRPHADIKFGGSELKMAVTGVPVGPDIASEMPEVENFCRLRAYGSYLVRKDGSQQQNFEEKEVLTVDSSFFQLFPLPLLAGDPKRCLSSPNTIAIDDKLARRYFGTVEGAMGQTLILDNDRKYQVTAVYEEMPSSTHFQADILISMMGNQEVEQSPPFWAMSNNFHTYILLKENIDQKAFFEKFRQFSASKVETASQQMLGKSVEELEATGQYARFELQKLTDIHLHSDLSFELSPNGSIQYVWVFGAIAAFVLFIACINFMNLTTARSSNRSKEIGVRKVLGSLRSSLIGQFLTESVLMTFVAVLLALGLVVIILPWFSEVSSREMSIPWSHPLFWASIVIGTLVVGLLAGSYPAFFLSGFNPLSVLKSNGTARTGGGNLRSFLVVFQFTTSIVLIIATILVFRQLSYIQNKKLGFQKDQLIIVNNAYALGGQTKVFKQEMLQYPGIQSGTISSFLPVPSSYSNTSFSTSPEFREDNTINMGIWTVDHDYQKTLGFEITQGRFFDQQFPTDSSAIILNKRAVEILGFEDPLGKKLYLPMDFDGGQNQMTNFEEYTIIGIMDNFHWESLRENIGPLSMRLGSSNGLITFKYEAAQSTAVINQLEATWKRLAPEQPFSYRFMDESFAGMYEAEQKIGSIATAFSLLAVLISCLGLFGLASYTVDQRTKEIGIRKVLGATSTNIISLLSKDYLKLVVIALIIASPIAYWGMERWLQDFAFRIDISWWIFLAAGLVAVLIAVLSVSFQSIKAAVSNPIDALRSE